MIANDTNEKYRRAATVFAAIIGGFIVAALVFYFVYLISAALLPFLYAAVIVYLTRPFVEKLADRNVPRMTAVLIAYLIVFVLLTSIMVFAVPVLIEQTNELVRLLPEFFDIGEKYFAVFKGTLPAELDSVFAELQNRAQDIAITIASGLPETVVGLFGGLLNIILAWLLAFYILKDLPAIKQTILELLPDRYRANVRHIYREVDFAVGSYLRGQVIVAAAVGLMITVWLTILGVEFAFLLGLLSAVLNIIPYFGAIVGGTAAFIVAMFDSVQLAIIVIIGIAVIQQFESVVISPVVMRRTVGLHPTTVVFSLLVAGALFGFLGLLLAIPIAAALKAILLHYVFARPVEVTEAVEET